MSAIRMECDHSITVLCNPWKDETREEIAQGIYLTRSYKNPSGILPKENIFISNNEQWFYWLGYHKKWQDEIPDTEEEIEALEKVFDYIEEYSSGNQLDQFIQAQCKDCNKKETLFCQIECSNGAI